MTINQQIHLVSRPTGEASVGDGFYIAQLANLVCLPSFGNGLIDAFAGFPGPLRFEARFEKSLNDSTKAVSGL